MTVDVWVLDIHRITEVAATATTAAERARAHGFVYAPAAVKFLAGRALTRHVLADRLGERDPRALEFEISPGGRPELADRSMSFNLAHSGDVVLLAVAPAPVGADVEQRRPERVTPALAERCLTRDERGAADSESFFTLWAAKEACMKAVGVGLAIDPSSFAAPRPWGDPVPRRVRSPAFHPVEPLGVSWIDAGARYAAAVAAPGTDWDVNVMAADPRSCGCR